MSTSQPQPNPQQPSPQPSPNSPEPVYGIIIINTETYKISWLKSFNPDTGEPILTDAAYELREYTSLLVAKLAYANTIAKLTREDHTYIAQVST